MDPGAKFRLGLSQASAADGLGRRELDVGLSTQRLVAAADGDGQCRARLVLRRSDRAPVRDGTQAHPRAAAVDADAGLSIPCAALQRQYGAARGLATRDV